MNDEPTRLHGGRLIAQRLKAHGVTRLFTLSGGHLFSLYEGCRHEGVELVDVRHEATATFAAEGWAKVTRQPGVAALTAGPGVTNGMSGMASALQNRSPIVVLGGRAPAFRWGQGSLQEIDHVPFVRPLVKLAATAGATPEIPGLVDEAFAVARRPHTGPVFLDFPLDVVFSEADAEELGASRVPRALQADGAALDRALALLADAERPVIMAGTNLYWGRGEGALQALAERRGIPVFLNGLARGCVPADHQLAFARARRTALGEADVALVVGVPMDFRLGFGAAFARGLRDRGHRRRRARARPPARGRRGALRRPVLDAVRARRRRPGHVGVGRASCARSRPPSARPSGPSSRTSARRCTRCASTASSRRCSTATRS